MNWDAYRNINIYIIYEGPNINDIISDHLKYFRCFGLLEKITCPQTNHYKASDLTVITWIGLEFYTIGSIMICLIFPYLLPFHLFLIRWIIIRHIGNFYAFSQLKNLFSELISVIVLDTLVFECQKTSKISL